MSAANLYWIDDSTKQMSMVLENMFPALWDNNYSCAVIFFGNQFYQEDAQTGLVKEDCEAFDRRIRDQFIVYCQKIDKYEWKDLGTTFRDKQDLLIKPSARTIPLKSQAPNETPEHIEQLISLWSDEAKLKELKEYAAKNTPEDALNHLNMSVEPLIEKMSLAPSAAVALDIYLLFQDDLRISYDLPVISMALYHALSKQHPCYLYSIMTTSQDMVSRWNETYTAVFQSSVPTIHSKYDLLTKKAHTPEKDALIKMLNNTRERTLNDERNTDTEEKMAQ